MHELQHLMRQNMIVIAAEHTEFGDGKASVELMKASTNLSLSQPHYEKVTSKLLSVEKDYYQLKHNTSDSTCS